MVVSTVKSNQDWDLSMCRDLLFETVKIFSSVESDFFQFFAFSVKIFKMENFSIKTWLGWDINLECLDNQDLLRFLDICQDLLKNLDIIKTFWVWPRQTFWYFEKSQSQNVLNQLTSWSRKCAWISKISRSWLKSRSWSRFFALRSWTTFWKCRDIYWQSRLGFWNV